MSTTTYASQITTASRSYLTLYIGLAVWFTAIVVLGLGQTFVTSPGNIPWPTILAISIPIILYLVAYQSNVAFRNYVLGFDQRVLILLHSWRMVGLGFVFLYFHGILPGLFALPAGIGDALAALFALLLGISMLLGRPVSQKRIWLWNSYGLLDFIIAVGIGIITSSLALTEISSSAINYFPLVVIPGFFVPAYAITHLFIFSQLKAGR